jgi:hypothetical protein
MTKGILAQLLESEYANLRCDGTEGTPHDFTLPKSIEGIIGFQHFDSSE